MCSCPMLALIGRIMKTIIGYCFCKPYVLPATQCLQGREDGSNAGKNKEENVEGHREQGPSIMFVLFLSQSTKWKPNTI